MSNIEPASCPNCGSPVNVEGWVVTVGPKEGALLTNDHVCSECGATFWYDDEAETETS